MKRFKINLQKRIGTLVAMLYPGVTINKDNINTNTLILVVDGKVAATGSYKVSDNEMSIKNGQIF